MSAVSTPTPTMRAMSSIIACRPFSAGAAALSLLSRCCSISLICMRTMRSRAMSRRDSSRVFSGRGVPSAERTCPSFSSALRKVGLNPLIPKARQRRLYSIDHARALADELFMFATGTLCVFLFEGRDRRHAGSDAFRPAASPGRRASGVLCRGGRSWRADVHANTATLDGCMT